MTVLYTPCLKAKHTVHMMMVLYTQCLKANYANIFN